MNNDPFDELQQISREKGVSAAIAFLVDQYRERALYPQLFESLKMQIRHELDLPLLYGEQPDDLSEEKQQQLEDRLLAACREVGTALFHEGRIEEGWMYLQPLADRDYLKDLVENVPVTDENANFLIEIALGQGVAPEFGYSLVLEQHGTCNSITTFDTQIAGFSKQLRGQLAALLVNHVYTELLENIRRHVTENEPEATASDSISDWIRDRDWMFQGGGHHLDVTHLASTVRIGKVCEQPTTLQQLVELCDYGTRLAEDFHFDGQAPFEKTYDDHIIYYRGLLGVDVDECVEHFRAKAFAFPIDEVGSEAMETLVDLLVRIGRNMQAVQISIDQLADREALMGIAPRVFDIAQQVPEQEALMEHFRQRDDLLGYAICMLRRPTECSQTQ